SSTTGSVATAVLLNNASTNVPTAAQYQPLRPSRSKFTYDKHVSAKKNMASVFLRSAIHATDSTFTGCTANTVAASHAPGTLNLASTRHHNTALNACRITFRA